MSRFSLARASHCMIVDGDYMIEATMLHGVRRVPRQLALDGSVIVGQVAFTVPCSEKGLDWARGQVGRPYDYAGAFGLAMAPDRNWMEDDAWFCFELAAGTLAVAGRDVFEVSGHVNGTMLMAVRP